MKRLLAILLFCGAQAFAACTGASPTWSCPADYTSLNNLLTGVQAGLTSGDTVNVAAGTITAAGALDSTLAIHLIGAGAGSTIITGTGITYVVTYHPVTAEVAKVYEFSGFTINNGANQFAARAPAVATPITGLNVHGNAFVGATNNSVNLTGSEFGVFYSNTYSGYFIAVAVANCSVGTPYAVGTCEAYAHAFGSANYPYFENETFTNGTNGLVSITEGGGRIALRHSTITGYICSGCEVFDAHGNQGAAGTISAEYYHNAIGNPSVSGRWLHHRGGQAVVMNNTISRLVAMDFTEYRAWDGNGVCQPYVATGQINDAAHGVGPAFYFNNLAAGSPQVPGYTDESPLNGTGCGYTKTDGVHEASSFITLNTDYYLPTYGLESALPATCTANGSTFYGTTDTDKIFKCISANTWSAAVASGGFTPYTYPHPLRSVSTPVPVATLTASLAVVKPGGTFTLTWGCTNTPTGANIDALGDVSPAAGGTTSAITVAPGTTTYNLTCTNAVGVGAAAVNVTQGGVKIGANTKLGANTVMQ